jgi:hypothetical protein
VLPLQLASITKFKARKCHSFIGDFIFGSTDEYNLIIFIGLTIDEYKVIFIDLDQAPMNIWVVQFNFDRPHIFVDEATSPTNIRGLY